MGKDWLTSHLHKFAQSYIGERHLPPLPYKHLALGRVYPSAVRLLWEEFRLNPQLGIVCFGMGKDWPTSHLYEFAQSHIGEKRLSPLPYKPNYKQHATIKPKLLETKNKNKKS